MKTESFNREKGHRGWLEDKLGSRESSVGKVMRGGEETQATNGNENHTEIKGQKAVRCHIAAIQSFGRKVFISTYFFFFEYLL